MHSNCFTAIKSAVVTISSLLFVSCVNSDYDFDKINTEITIAQGGISFPIGNTRQLTMKDFIGDTDSSDDSTGGTDDFLTTVDGKYSISFSEYFSAPELLYDLTGKLHISDIVYENTFSLSGVSGKAGSSAMVRKSAPIVDENRVSDIVQRAGSAVVPNYAFKDDFNEYFEIVLISPKDLPTDVKIKSVSKLALDEVYARIEIQTSVASGINPEIDMTVDFPDEIILDETDNRVSGNSLKFSGKFNNGKIVVAPVKIAELNLSRYDFSSDKDLIAYCRAHGTYTISGTGFSIIDYGGKVDNKITMSVKDINFKMLAGKFEYAFNIEPVCVDFGDVPSIIKNAVLDFYNPYLTLDLKSNLNIPLTASIKLVPVWNSSSTVAGGNGDRADAVNIQIPYEPCKDAASPSVQKFFVAATDEGRSQDRSFIENYGLKSILKHLPDQVNVDATIAVESERESVIEPAVQALFDADYSLVCPLSFGPELFMEASDTLTGIDESLAEIIVDNVVQITGSVINTMPLQLNLKIDLLDGSDNILPLKGECKQPIASCSRDGKASTTDLACTLAVGDGVSAEDIKSIKLTYGLSSGSAVGIPITESSYVQAHLSLTLPEGLSLDIDKKENSKNGK